MVRRIRQLGRIGQPARTLLSWPGWRRPGARFGLHALATAAIIAAVGCLGVYVLPATAGNTAAAPVPTASGPTVPPDGPPPQGPGPTSVPTPDPTSTGTTPGSGRPQEALASWAVGLEGLDIPRVALQAYGYAELTMGMQQPACHLTWPTLAGIGKIESNHGEGTGGQLLPDGRSVPPIYGQPLDGNGNRKLIRDTDHGQLDGDPVYDRAVGPMQFIPSTWQNWGTDGDGDSRSDPFDLNDAALSAARYLCANGRDLATGAGWWQAILSYNGLSEYAQNVFVAADAYGRGSRTP